MDSLQTLFDQVAIRIKRYVPPLSILLEEDGRLDVYSDQPVEIDGRKRKNIHFASVIRHPSYVGWYFMPVYASSELVKVFSPDLTKLLKGKSCFHLKKETSTLLSDIENALRIGFEIYTEKGWVK